jgi:hypothetical protein
MRTAAPFVFYDLAGLDELVDTTAYGIDLNVEDFRNFFSSEIPVWILNFVKAQKVNDLILLRT